MKSNTSLLHSLLPFLHLFMLNIGDGQAIAPGRHFFRFGIYDSGKTRNKDVYTMFGSYGFVEVGPPSNNLLNPGILSLKVEIYSYQSGETDVRIGEDSVDAHMKGLLVPPCGTRSLFLSNDLVTEGSTKPAEDEKWHITTLSEAGPIKERTFWNVFIKDEDNEVTFEDEVGE